MYGLGAIECPPMLVKYFLERPVAYNLALTIYYAAAHGQTPTLPSNY